MDLEGPAVSDLNWSTGLEQQLPKTDLVFYISVWIFEHLKETGWLTGVEFTGTQMLRRQHKCELSKPKKKAVKS